MRQGHSSANASRSPTVAARTGKARKGARRLMRLVGLRRAAIAVAALPLFQATGCYPDPLGAVNFELQRLISGTLINAFNIVVRNLLDL